MNEEDLRPYLSGEKLYGDDFDRDQMEAWYRDEAEGYAQLAQAHHGRWTYGYEALNRRWGFRHLPAKRVFQRALGFGSAFGDEFLPVIERIREVTIIEPSDEFVQPEVHGIPVRYVKPSVSGDLPFEGQAFDLVLCFGVLHHICNVSHVLREMFRCLAPGGFALLREPIVSMGDWTRPRRSLTKRERGIPDALLRGMIEHAGFRVVHAGYCVFRPIPKLMNMLGVAAYNSRWLTWLDAMACHALSFNRRYHRTRFLEKFGPQSVFYVLTRA